MSYRRPIAAVLFAAASLLAANAPASAQRRAAARPAAAASSRVVLPKVPYTEFRLANGLRVIFHEDHSTPIVAVNVWYHVGSKNEVAGRTGFAHLFEHMMFQGSRNYDNDYFGPIQQAGGNLNGSTNPDRTNYWQVVPSNFLELALFMEADRMGGLLEAMTEEKLANQRDVVKNEKRQNYDNRPYGLVGAKISETLYPPDHPYHWLTIGSLDDLTAATMEDVKGFFRRYYHPGNASLSIAGDFDPATARRLVEKHFGPIAAGPKVAKVNVKQPALDSEQRVQMTDRVSLSRVYLTWHAVPAYHPDEAALDAAASILGGGKSSRLYKVLVYERQIAQDVNASNPSGELAGRFQVTSTAKPGTSLADIEQVIDAEVAKLQAAPPSREEMERFYNQFEANFVYSLQEVGGFGGKSDQLNHYAIMRGTPGWFEQDLARYRKVTAADVQRVAKQYLGKNRLALTVTPMQAPATAAAPAPAAPPAGPAAAASTATTASAAPRGAAPGAPPKPQIDSAKLAAQKAALPKAGPTASFRLPRMQRRTLSNGLEVRLVEHHEMPVLGMQLIVRGGGAADPADHAGLASVTADLLDEGTATRDALTLSGELDAIGARLLTFAEWDANGMVLLTTTRQADRGLELFADILLRPAFPEKDFDRLRNQRLTGLRQRRDNPIAIADLVYTTVLYGSKHPYGHSMFGTEPSLRQITLKDIRAYYDSYYRPNNSTLIVVGDITMDRLVPKLEKAFAGWQKGDVPPVDLTPPPPREKAVIYLVDKPGAAQSVLSIGHVGVERGTADYYPLLVMNAILGGQFSSRVNMNLRETKGYTYGARTGFDYRRGAGPFTASAGVQTAVTKESVFEFMKELRGIRGDMPITEAELEFAKQSLVRGFPRTFETPEQIAGRLATVALYGLPDDYFDSYVERVSAVTADDVKRVATRYLDPDRMAIVVVGDRAVVEKGLRELEGIGASITLLDLEGNPVTPTP